ncbi:16S rRNA (cytidine(1402)-2'-O)-methyltransferase [Pelistega ratti]|uniref:16S rRNA (cytidine(1402)-2'-O)-methyltransferase n=1 Tax=Pelistega ratti TaxID=2652177 RepID=UPI0013573CFF|nr:16S rRNA (cytidine(1402)-2'-O)-methyltransferase [Pelistega ratti]
MSMCTGQFSPIIEKNIEELSRQYWSEATLYVVATPIGNLGDISLRALYTLQLVDVIACEDTRTSKALLNSWGIEKPLMAAHQHNEVQAAQQIIMRLSQGQRVALISDAGAPAVSDPGGKLVSLVKEAGFEVRAIPGASAVITALMSAGVTSDENPAFTFAGFVPPKAKARQQWFDQWSKSAAVVLMFESPHRIVDSVKDFISICGEERPLGIGRELTKRFEQVTILPAKALLAWLEEDINHQRGEFVLILPPVNHQATIDEQMGELDRLLKVMLPVVSVKDAVSMATSLSGLSKDIVYKRALVLKDK